MDLKTKAAVGAAALLTAFAAGRCSVSKPAVKEVVQEKTKENVDVKTDTKTKTVIVKEGGKETTTILQDTITDTVDTKTTSETAQVSVTPPKVGTLNLSALAGTSMHNFMPVYGLSVSKQFIGPVTVGLYGMTNGTVGVSVGLNF